MSMRAELRFYAELKDFLPSQARRSGRVTHVFDVPGSVKDVIEACGVPHTEVDLILADGASVDFDHRVTDGERISVYPVFEAMDISPLVKVRPQPLRRVRFVLDGHLRRLARYLRLLGFDSVCDDEWSDHDLVTISSEQGRILLTRDVGLLKHRSVTHGYYVRATDPRRQLVEVVRRFHLSSHIDPLTRCMACNGTLQAIDKGAIADRLPAGTADRFDAFSACPQCGRVYWEGSHVAQLMEIVEEARRAEE